MRKAVKHHCFDLKSEITSVWLPQTAGGHSHLKEMSEMRDVDGEPHSQGTSDLRGNAVFQIRPALGHNSDRVASVEQYPGTLWRERTLREE